MICRHGVGAGIGDHAVDVEAEESVAHSWRGTRHRDVAYVGKGAVGQHVNEVGGAFAVCGLQVA